MKSKLLFIISTLALFTFPNVNFGQVINLGTAADFVLFSTVGAVSNTGITHLTGNVGTNNGSSTGFGNVDGGMHDNDLVSGQCAADLLIAYNQLNATIPTFFPAPLLGNGQTLIPGVYEISGATTMNLDLTLDAQGNPNAVFIIRILGPLSTNANSKVKLINNALACNVYWQVEGLVSMASGTTMRGTVIANNAAISMNTGDTLEGRVLSTAGAVTVDGILAYTPIGCGSPVLTGPLEPNLVSVECYALFSSSGPVTNSGTTYVTGDVGTNSGLTTGFNPLFVAGMIHPIPDGSTAAASTDLLNAYNYLNLLPSDIELLYPAQFGGNLVLTPHKYIMNGAVTFTDTVYLNAQGNANAVFVIHTFGAFSTSTYSKVILINGTQVENVYWVVDGALDINDYSDFKGTIICNNGAMDLNTGVTLEGRALTTTGALNTTAITVTMPIGCGTTYPPNIISGPANQTACVGDSVSFTVTATGTGLTYQWRKGTVNLIDGGNISGTNTPTLTFYPVNALDAATNYNVIVGGATAPNDTSANVSLTVNTAPIITSDPTNQTGCNGSSVSFSVTATGGGLTYQWRKGVINLINGGNISGATSSVLTINPLSISDAAPNYNVIISGSCSPNDTSINASLSVTASSTTIITTQPVSQTVCAGGSASFSVTATGTGLTYQWKKGAVNLVNGGNISGATSATLTINPVNILDAETNYYVVIGGVCAPNVTSLNVALIVNTAPSITASPADQTVCDGSSASFSVTSTGTGLVYQWRKGVTNLINGGNISGATSAVLTINPASFSDTAYNYNVVISGVCAPNVTSPYVSLTVNPVPVVSLGTGDIVQPGPSATLNAGGGFASYLWSTSDTTQTITVNTNGTYIVFVTNEFGCSNSDTIQVNFTNVIINEDGSIVIIAMYPNPSNGPINLSIQNMETDNLVVDLLDMTGRVVYNRYIGSVSGSVIEPFDFTSLTMGIYFLRMTANGNSVQMKLIISK